MNARFKSVRFPLFIYAFFLSAILYGEGVFSFSSTEPGDQEHPTCPECHEQNCICKEGDLCPNCNEEECGCLEYELAAIRAENPQLSELIERLYGTHQVEADLILQALLESDDAFAQWANDIANNTEDLEHALRVIYIRANDIVCEEQAVDR